ncbi:DUF2971 domain-containing protein [Burkholderia pseudomallei]|uniref:DUF2971 domain-containing protein n=1 Tax=Burkholderia pseudomallei TaxID=28450 RepID=UPI0004F7B31F|nr:DUF2971 domain-containing protein [Burkholderia pseudomallei]AIP72577.1 hypothetical protein DU27_3179 [Burkholderia pseudomallei]AJW92081.1 hypothetical protein BG92_2104 [Burkholderia pseudomallei 406e]CAJ3137665.1 Protein of uncharacterised function (DUF2971) [Burkholderia pseudomallei]CAJ3164663.1 Protein of uncharacterised function (DUF2971) [Burkholderia pseudomallei]CAJ3858524.1 Protein of uncharacterised function (DUF2971) [Burkholderia pseudomallei]
MRLYYLTAEKWARKSIDERRLKISLFEELNDPFELLPHVLPSREHRKIAEVLRKYLSKQRGVICFSTDWQNPVMWAHYGAKHYGICLGFDVPDELAMRVSYESNRLDFNIDLSAPNAGVTPEMVKAMLLTKFEAWRYENEYRVMAELQDKDADGHYYADFGENLTLREVIIGVRCAISQREVAQWIGDLGYDVEIRKARLAFKQFKITEQLKQAVFLAGHSRSK